MHLSVYKKLDSIKALFRRHQVETGYLFGSALTNHYDEQGDVDFLVTLKQGLQPEVAGEHLWLLEEDLENLLNRSIDLVTENSLKNPWFIQELEKTRVKIYGNYSATQSNECQAMGRDPLSINTS